MNTQNIKDNFLTVRDLKKRYGIGNDAAYSLVRSEGFPAFVFSNKFLIREDLLLKWEEDEVKRTHARYENKHR